MTLVLRTDDIVLLGTITRASAASAPVFIGEQDDYSNTRGNKDASESSMDHETRSSVLLQAYRRPALLAIARSGYLPLELGELRDSDHKDPKLPRRMLLGAAGAAMPLRRGLFIRYQGR
jgi:hypothetical protein